MIASLMGEDVRYVRNYLKLIAVRRNAIVHEADIDPIYNKKQPIAHHESQDITNFIEKCGAAIYDLVKI